MRTERLTTLLALAGALAALGAGCGEEDDTTDRSPGGTTVQSPHGDTQTLTREDETTTRETTTQGSGRTTPTDIRTDTGGGDDDGRDDARGDRRDDDDGGDDDGNDGSG